MYATIDQLKVYKQAKKQFAKQFGANESTVQKCVDELISVSKTNTGVLTPTLVVNYINANPTCNLQRIFDTLNPTTQVQKLAIIESVLVSIPLLIGLDNVVYSVSNT